MNCKKLLRIDPLLMFALSKTAKRAKVAQTFVTTYKIMNKMAGTCLNFEPTCAVKTISFARGSVCSKLSGSSSST